jgi:hypothetical protein
LSEDRVVLEYGQPPPSVGRRAAGAIVRWGRWARWFFLRRPLRGVEVAMAGWLTAAVSYAMLAGHAVRMPAEWLRAYVCVSIATAVAGAGAVVWLVARRRWRALLLWVAVVVPSGILSGVFQIEHCPHATYVQIMGGSIPIAGDPCGNPRKIAPWWMRE